MRIKYILMLLMASIIFSCNIKKSTDKANVEQSSSDIAIQKDSNDIIVAVFQDAMKRNKYWHCQDILAKYYNKYSNKYLLKTHNNQFFLKMKDSWYGKYDKIEIVDSAYVKEHGLRHCIIGNVHYQKDSISVVFSTYYPGHCYSYYYLKNSNGEFKYSSFGEVYFKPKYNKFWVDVDIKCNQILKKGGFDFRSFCKKKFIDKDTFYVFINDKDPLTTKDTVKSNIYCRFHYNDYSKLHNERLKRSKQLNEKGGKIVVTLPEEPIVSFQIIGKTKTVSKLPATNYIKLTRKNFRNYSMRTKHSVFYLIEKDKGYKITPSKLRSSVY